MFLESFETVERDTNLILEYIFNETKTKKKKTVSFRFEKWKIEQLNSMSR